MSGFSDFMKINYTLLLVLKRVVVHPTIEYSLGLQKPNLGVGEWVLNQKEVNILLFRPSTTVKLTKKGIFGQI